MRRITTAARSLAGRVPSLLRFVIELTPDLLLVGGYLAVGYALRGQRVGDVELAWLWLGLVPFVAGALVTVDQYRRARRSA